MACSTLDSCPRDSDICGFLSIGHFLSVRFPAWLENDDISKAVTLIAAILLGLRA